MKIFLIGMSASGKSTLGKSLARNLGIPFVDLDSEIEREAGSDVKTIFRLYGEEHFRTLESENLRRWCRSEVEFVMATGGGAPCFFEGIDVINRSGKSIFLDVPSAELISRLSKTPRDERPLLGKFHADDLRERITTLLRDRLPFYTKATIRLSGPDITVNDLQQAITGNRG